jgi:GNAT superfamily N-acetyltransferase
MTGPRLLRPSDIPGCMRLKEAAGWNQTEEDWRRVLDLEPEGCFGIDRGDHLVATTTAICYGRRLAWIGMVLTDPEYRGQGLATQLMRHTLEFLDSRGLDWIKLDATAMGRPLYRRLGFVDECPIERWERAPMPAEPVLLGGYEPDAAMDLRAFGADRSKLLSRLASRESASAPGSGYAMGRPGSIAAYFGPCVASSPDAAQGFVQWFVTRHSAERIFWDLLPANQQALSLAQKFGFQRVRELVRMGRGAAAPLQTDAQQLYAMAGFEFG